MPPADTSAGKRQNGHGPHAGPYIEDFDAFRKQLPAVQPAFLKSLRESAIAHFAHVGFPTVKEEEWRFTNVTPIAETTFHRAVPGEGLPDADAVQSHLFDGACHLVFVDGHFVPALSSLTNLPPGVHVGGLAEALAVRPGDLEPHLGQHVSFDKQPFVALNTAFLHDGAHVYVPQGVVVETPIHLLFIGTGSDGPTVSYPRNLIVAEESAQVTVVETYVGSGDGTYFSCGVTEVATGRNAVVDHYKVQREDLDAFHMATLQLTQGRDSTFASHAISTGGGLVRYDVNAFLDGEGVDCTLNGLYLATGDQHVDHHMWVEHAQPHGYSHELYKGILDGRARAVFNGRIYVHQGAQKTDAVQSNRNLLLSDNALVNSNPQLEIFADDVRCTHGSTVGQLDADSVFYLRSRGIGEEAARSILIYAFAGDIVEGIKVEAIRTDLENLLFQRLPKGDVVRQAV